MKQKTKQTTNLAMEKERKKTPTTANCLNKHNNNRPNNHCNHYNKEEKH